MSDKTPFGQEVDPFDEEFQEDPFVDDHFGSRQGPARATTGPEALPDSTSVLVLGILSIFGVICMGVVGIILGIVAITMASKPENLYRADPDRYTPSSYSNVRAGKICGVVGLVISGIYFVVLLMVLLAGGF